MTEMLFCYCCRVHHPKEQMCRFSTKRGDRWRCIRSIEAAAGSVQERDRFGREQTAINRQSASCTAQVSTRLRWLRRNAQA